MSDYEKEHGELVRRLGAECAVLLKTDGRFPLKAPGKLALYGNGARRTVKGGTGSGEVNSRYFVTIEQGLENAGFKLTTKLWMDAYDKVYADARASYIKGLKQKARKHHTLAITESMGAVMAEPEYDIPEEGAGDTAVYVLSRNSGEGSDRIAEAGDVLLTKTETRDILKLNEEYENFLLVLNTGGPVDLSPVLEVPNILILSQLGAETGNILADLILGRSFPSGKLATTWTRWEDYPKIGTFGCRDDTDYTEGVYVGYRYFGTVGKEVLFPFGFGLSYTDFEIYAGETRLENGEVSVKAYVKNVGEKPGREVAQVYVSAPQGRIDKPFRTLAAFKKSETVMPGAEEELTLSFSFKDLASYDEALSKWVLEGGDYVVYLGTSSEDVKPVAILRLDGEAVVKNCENKLGDPGFEDWKPEERREETLPDLPVINVTASSIEPETADYAVPEDVDPLIESLTDEELCYMNIGAFDPKGGILSVIGNASMNVAGAAGETTRMLNGKGIPAIVMADGPAGLRLSRQYVRTRKGVKSLGGGSLESLKELLPKPAVLLMKLSEGKKTKGEVLEQNCTAIPIGTAIAQSFNVSLAEALGDVVGDEMERFGVQLWLAPALNIHRSILCGRNFEYFSEDPLLTGKMAAALTRGVQKHQGCGVTVKHYAANNQETDRYNSNSRVSERALREIYLKGFEIAVKEGRPHALMTSYNLINGIHTCENRELIEDLLRAEFGYEGIVMTDWIVSMMYGGKHKHARPSSVKTAAAGNDLTMPGSSADYKTLLEGLQNGLVSKKQLQVNATRVLRTAGMLAKE
ncbi:MAG: glycoside hydrolase family 3 C-terminal domain-containing protein [Lachnospiraceae bacterium]|nr:glycoside hydrolase family 3 C-terminal domain-containing protein [Lachnospiraceae bacterium]